MNSIVTISKSTTINILSFKENTVPVPKTGTNFSHAYFELKFFKKLNGFLLVNLGSP